jgi:hypothetical protein
MSRKAVWIFLVLTMLSAPLRATPMWPDTFQGRLKALALLETLNANLLASSSATQTLEDWCAAHHMAAQPTLHAHLDRGMQKPLPAGERARLQIEPDESVIYRRVDLACGSYVLSRADNWYVPSRLTPAMDRELASTDIPFGRAVKDLHPRRQTFAVTILWHPLPAGWEMAPAPPDHSGAELAIPAILFEHRAIVFAGDGKPISEVDERYTSDILDFASGK